MAENASVQIQPGGRQLKAFLDGKLVAEGWLVINIEELDDDQPAVIRLLFAGKRTAAGEPDD